MTITLAHRARVDDEALRFRPFRTGRGLKPRGFVHALRRGVYKVSQWSRPSREAQRRMRLLGRVITSGGFDVVVAVVVGLGFGFGLAVTVTVGGGGGISVLAVSLGGGGGSGSSCGRGKVGFHASKEWQSAQVVATWPTWCGARSYSSR